MQFRVEEMFFTSLSHTRSFSTCTAWLLALFLETSVYSWDPLAAPAFLCAPMSRKLSVHHILSMATSFKLSFS